MGGPAQSRVAPHGLRVRNRLVPAAELTSSLQAASQSPWTRSERATSEAAYASRPRRARVRLRGRDAVGDLEAVVGIRVLGDLLVDGLVCDFFRRGAGLVLSGRPVVVTRFYVRLRSRLLLRRTNARKSRASKTIRSAEPSAMSSVTRGTPTPPSAPSHARTEALLARLLPASLAGTRAVPCRRPGSALCGAASWGETCTHRMGNRHCRSMLPIRAGVARRDRASVGTR